MLPLGDPSPSSFWSASIASSVSQIADGGLACSTVRKTDHKLRVLWTKSAFTAPCVAGVSFDRKRRKESSLGSNQEGRVGYVIEIAKAARRRS
jgi:hypothetical protein